MKRRFQLCTGPAAMQRTCEEFDTEQSRRARERQPVWPVSGERPHRWQPSAAGPHVFMFSNDGSANQYKAQIWSTPPPAGGNTFYARIRGFDDILLFDCWDEATDWVEEQVALLLAQGHDFQQPVQGKPG